ncbi:bifunctional DNA-formamidopyrimidine glycosylase/DNA-(apurinic or apyrimidinic site) lyase [Leucobacter sp. NPDC015123]|uniref:bifunctional DNA-formamidopyrimidine glycosylase/DNA-(apurinic or apyrimidinic site) lyase n=1 Tax=Leucobacter sp. NPDC015123 TaxID=3364129 RepID=UPI0036F45790
MPELPEVEVVRAGLAPAVTGARVVAVEVMDPRALKRHTPAGEDPGLGGHGRTLPEGAARSRAADFERRLTGRTLQAPQRRGKFLWIPLAVETAPSVSGKLAEEPETALLAHLGMSGQMLLRATDAVDDRHVRIRTWIEHPEHGELRVDFADQRLFGSLALDALTPAAPIGSIPAQAAHIARDPLDPHFDDTAFVEKFRSRGVGAKKLLLDQRMVSGVGNIYADETLWRARIHPDTPGSAVSVRGAVALLHHLREVFEQALSEGGTSFDEQYVNVNGQAGRYASALNVYGRNSQDCSRCGNTITRIRFMGRYSHLCLVCQRKRG